MRKLAGLQFRFAYKKGSENKVAVALSRVRFHFQLNVVSTIVPVWVQLVLNSYQTNTSASALLQDLAITQSCDLGNILVDGVIKYQNRIWVGSNSALQTKLIASFHSSTLGGHSGIQPTYQRLKKMFHWQEMRQDVESFVKHCQVC
jgi:hypothetical protein